MKNTKLKLIGLTLIALSLSACGGGSGSSSQASATSFPFKMAYTNFILGGWSGTFSVTATGGGLSCVGAGTHVFNPANQTTSFNVTPTQSVAAVSSSDTLSMYWNSGNCNSLNLNTETFFAASSGTPLGDIAGGTYEVVTASNIPTTVQVGSNDTLLTQTTYSDSTETSILGTTTETYSVTAGADANTAIFTTTAVQGTSSEITSYSLTTSGVLKPISQTIISGGTTIAMKF